MVNFAFTLDNFEYWLLILVRITCFIYIAPFFGQSGIPNQVKIGLSVFISLLLYSIVPRPDLTYASVVGYAVVVLKEGITGLLIGFAANICNSIVLFAGNIIDMDIGLSMATEFNPDMGTESTLTGSLYYYLVLLLLVSSNLHTYLIRAIADSFTVIELCAWYYGKSCTTDEYVFCWYAIESPGWIYCIVFNSLFASKCCRLYFFRNQNDGEVNCRRYVLMKTC